ncbi:MAG: MBL fold metallo-hydrolase [Hyphomicrobiales bacterium]
MTLVFDRNFDPNYGRPVEVAPGVRRITAENPGPFTFHGTNTYIVGSGRVAVIDPGPDDPAHVEAILAATSGETITHILVTHTHNDHSPASRPLAARTGAPILAEGPHRAARPLEIGEINPLDASSDQDFRPDVVLADGDRVAGGDWTIEAVTTPGHTANHLVFSLAGEGVLFSGDHVMGWSTSIVAPPDGAMVDYMASLEKLLARGEGLYLSAHGAPIRDAMDYVAGLKAHRLGREQAVLDRLAAGDDRIADMVRAIYEGLDARLFGAAALNVLAHLEDLVARGLAETDGAAAIGGAYRLK